MESGKNCQWIWKWRPEVIEQPSNCKMILKGMPCLFKQEDLPYVFLPVSKQRDVLDKELLKL